MAELRLTLENIGLSRVQTYIQSGNILFESEEEVGALRKRIEGEIETVFGFFVTVVLRTEAELDRIIENCPFSKQEISEAEASSEGESLYVSLLLDTPSQENYEWLGTYQSEYEKCTLMGREVYLLFHQSVRNSKLANNLNKLNVPSTMRNWKTINKLSTMAKTMEV